MQLQERAQRPTALSDAHNNPLPHNGCENISFNPLPHNTVF